MVEAPQEHSHLLQLEAATLADVQQYGNCPLTDKARVQKLSLGIQDKLSQIRGLTRDLELLVEELDSDEERQGVEVLLAQHKAQYDRIQAAFKQAALAQRTTALRSAAEERRELLSGADASARQRKLQTEADSVALAEDVTGGLRRIRQVLAEELEHTSATLAAMETSHTSLAKTRNEYQGQHGRLKRSRGLLGTLNWQAKSETYMLWFGLSMFVLVCAYIFQKRAGHFIPEPLKPAFLLKAVGITGRTRPSPVSVPSAWLRPQTPPPRARGATRESEKAAAAAAEEQAGWEDGEALHPSPPRSPGPGDHIMELDVNEGDPPYEPLQAEEEVEQFAYAPSAASTVEEVEQQDEEQVLLGGQHDPLASTQGEAVAEQSETVAQTEPDQEVEPEWHSDVEQATEPEQPVEPEEEHAEFEEQQQPELADALGQAAQEAAVTSEKQQPVRAEWAAEEQQEDVEQEAVPVESEAAAAKGAPKPRSPAQPQQLHQQQQPGQASGSSTEEPELLDPLPQPAAASGKLPELVDDAAAKAEEAAVWPEGAPDPGSPAQAAAAATRTQQVHEEL